MATTTSITADPGSAEVVMTHTFDAPPERVFEAYTDPEAIPHWWGPGALGTVEVDHMEVREGGGWRFVQRSMLGEVAFTGTYQEVVPGVRLVYAFGFEGMPDAAATETMTFEAQPGGKTLLTGRTVFPSIEARNAMVANGMEQGARETMARLAAYLAASA